MTEKLKWLVPRDPVSVDRQLLQWDLYPRKEFIMTSYELIGLLIGFGILLATAAMWVAVLNALDEGTHGCSREFDTDDNEDADAEYVQHLESKVERLSATEKHAIALVVAVVENDTVRKAWRECFEQHHLHVRNEYQMTKEDYLDIRISQEEELVRHMLRKRTS